MTETTDIQPGEKRVKIVERKQEWIVYLRDHKGRVKIATFPLGPLSLAAMGAAVRQAARMAMADIIEFDVTPEGLEKLRLIGLHVDRPLSLDLDNMA